MNGLFSSANEADIRYPNLCQACQWVANLSLYEAQLVIWAYKNHIAQIDSKRVTNFGGAQHIIDQAYRYRNT
jgi:hypothetical protein